MSNWEDLSNAPDEDAYFKQCVDILPEAIREEFVRVPSDLAFWGERYAAASKEYLLAEQERKRAWAQARLALRGAATAAGQRVTEGDLEAQVEMDAAYYGAKLAEIEAEAAKIAAKVKFDSVSAKREMVVSLGATIRAEMAPSGMRQ